MHIHKQHFQSCFCSDSATLATDMIQDCSGKKIHQKENQTVFHLELHKMHISRFQMTVFQIYTEENFVLKVVELHLGFLFRRKRGQGGWAGCVKLLCIRAQDVLGVTLLFEKVASIIFLDALYISVSNFGLILAEMENVIKHIGTDHAYGSSYVGLLEQ